MRLSVTVAAPALLLCSFVSLGVCLETCPGRGFVPPPFADHHVEVSQPRGASALPVRFDWRELSAVTPVKNQGSCGACYAFAGLGDIESKLLMAGEGAFDFSENNLKECEWFARTGHHPSGCDGGTYWRIINLMAEKGTVMESCDPYVPCNSTCNSTCSYVKTVLDWRVITLGEVPSPGLLKSYLTEYGPIFVAMDGGISSAWQNELNNYDGSYTLHYTGSYSVNHAVLIVGWDDTLSHAGGQGAWIVKNSWGSNWGGTAGYGTEKGYFTIAYGSANIGWYSSFLKGWKDFDPCDRLLFYDEAGYYGNTGFGNTTAWGLCKFLMPEDAELRRVEFWTTDATTDVDVFVYDEFDGSVASTLLASELDNSFAEMGYHSVPLASPLPMITGQDFYVAVKITTAGYNYPITYDPQDIGPIAPGRSYISAGGATWTEYLDGDIGVRARINLDRDCEPPAKVSSFSAAAARSEIVLKWTNPADGDFSHTALRYSIAHYPMTTEDGAAIDNGEGGLFYNPPASTDSFAHIGLSRDVTYYYSAFAADTVFNYSAASHACATTDRWITRKMKLSDPDTPLLQGARANLIGWRSLVGGKVEIQLSAGAEGPFRLVVYDVSGRLVKTLYHDTQTPGPERVVWDGTRENGAREGPGIYFIHLQAGDLVATQKVVLIR